MTADGQARSYHHGDLRKALLAAGEAELAEKGVEGFTLRGCAKRAGVSHAAPAHHFKDANALLTALATEGFQRFIAAMRKRQESAATPQERLTAAGLGYVDFARANPALFRLMFSSSRPDCTDAVFERTSRESFDILLESVSAVRSVDPMADRDAMIDVAAAWAMVHGIAELLLSERTPFLAAVAGGNPDTVFAELISRSVPMTR